MFDNLRCYSIKDASLLNSQQLAFVGDAVYSCIIRSMLVSFGNQKTNELHKMANKYVKASAQFEALKILMPYLTEKENDVVRRAINYKTNNIAKHASIEEYKHATGFEALIGYLYITNQTERLEQLVSIVLNNRMQ